MKNKKNVDFVTQIKKIIGIYFAQSFSESILAYKKVR